MRKRRDWAGEISDAVSSGEQSFAEGVLQVAGKVGVGGTFDLIGEGLVSIFRALPDAIEEPIRSAGSFLLNTSIGKAGLEKLGQGIETYNEWKAQNPRAARNIESVIDIGLMFAPVRGKAPTGQTRVGSLGERAAVSGERALERQKVGSVEKLVRLKQVKGVREAQVGRTKEGTGLLRQKQIQPSTPEKSIINEVSKIRGVTETKTLQGSFNLISKEVEREAKKLISDLRKNDFLFPRKELLSRLRATKSTIAESPTIVGDAQKVADKLVDAFERFANENKATGSGLLQARKDFDNWIRQQKDPKIFDPKNENALSISLREIRQTANKFLDEKATKVEVKESLKKQSRLFQALDNIKPKAADEAGNAIQRAWQRAVQVLGVKNQLIQVLAASAGIGGLGAAAIFAPFVRNLLIGLGLAYFAGKLIVSPKTRIFLGKLLESIDKAIKSTKDANLVRELRADRALILEILESSVDSATEGEVEQESGVENQEE